MIITISGVPTRVWWSRMYRSRHVKPRARLVSALFLLAATTVKAIDSSTTVRGCRELNYCSGHGMCVARGIGAPVSSCQCFDGFGSPRDIATSPAPDCSRRVCPAGPAWGDVAVAKPKNASRTFKNAHAYAECSDAGRCNTDSGTCECFKGHAGRACERLSCPGEPEETCSGRGQCLSLRQLSKLDDALPLTNSTFVYGPSASDAAYWDDWRVFKCHCDSSWKVGLGPGDVQLPEFYGPDCSMRRCPSGDDPQTERNELDCTNVTSQGAGGGLAKGKPGNLCHVDCSNRGLCNTATGLCSCFSGFTGHNCDTRIDV